MKSADGRKQALEDIMDTMRGLFALMMIALLAAPASAGDTRLGGLTIGQPWARASAGKARAGAAYVTITNLGREVDRLVKTETPVAATAALHTHRMEAGIMKMRPVKAVEINPGEPTVMKPGGLHIMLMGLSAPLKEGETFPLTLTFEKAGSIVVRGTVERVGAMAPAHRHPGSAM